MVASVGAPSNLAVQKSSSAQASGSGQRSPEELHQSERKNRLVPGVVR